MIINLDFLSDYMEDNVSYRKEKDYIYILLYLNNRLKFVVFNTEKL